MVTYRLLCALVGVDAALSEHGEPRGTGAAEGALRVDALVLAEGVAAVGGRGALVEVATGAAVEGEDEASGTGTEVESTYFVEGERIRPRKKYLDQPLLPRLEYFTLTYYPESNIKKLLF